MNEITNRVKNIVCDNFKGRVTGKETTLQMLKLFVAEPQVQEYCLKKNYPSIEQLDTIKDEALFFNVFINKVKTVIDAHKVFVFGNSVMKIITTGHKVCNIIATNNSFIEIKAMGNSIINLELYEDAEYFIDKSDTAKVNLIKK